MEHFFDKTGVVMAALEIGIFHDFQLERDGGFNAADDEFAEGPLHAQDGVLAVGTDGDELADHRIVVRRNGISGIDVGIDSHAASAGSVIKIDFTWGRLEIIGGILGIDAAFDGVGTGYGVDDVLGEVFPGGDEDLFLDEIATINFLGNGVLHLDAGVHFHEIKVALVIDEKFHGAGIFVADSAGECDGGVAHFLA